MHELSLFGQVPSWRHEQVLKILAGIAGMQPQRVLERHLIFKPSRSPTQRGGQVGGSQGVQAAQIQALQGQMHGDLFYLQLVGDISPGFFGQGETIGMTTNPQDVVMSDGHEDGPLEGQSLSDGISHANGIKPASRPPGRTWSLQFRDLPEVAGRRPVTSRLMADITITSGNTLSFMEALGYHYVSEYILEGHQFIHGNLIILLHRHLRMSVNSSSALPRDRVPPINTLQSLDPSGAYIVQASIRVQDGNKPETMTMGINELKAFKDLMKGVVELEVGDRLALDTRAR